MHPVRHFERVERRFYSFKVAMSINIQMSFSAMFNGRKPCLCGDAANLRTRGGVPNPSQIGPIWDGFGTPPRLLRAFLVLLPRRR
jgi:hypothetical protein